MIESAEKKWYALYVRSKAEKKVLAELEILGVESYLPLIERIRKWSDRNRKIQEPLFRSYVFVHVGTSDFFSVRNVPNVLKYVSFSGKAVVIPDQQIEAIRSYLGENDRLNQEELSEIQEGQLVRIRHGQMAGLIGRMVKYRNKFRLIIMVEAVGQLISINIPRSKVDPINEV